MTTQQGKFVWRELVSNDVAVSAAFYSSVLGWNVVEQEVGGSPYTFIAVGEKMQGGIVPAEQAQRGYWLPFLSVDAVSNAAEAAREGGASLLGEAVEMSGVGHWQIAADRESHQFVLFKGDGTGDAQGEGQFCWDELWSNAPKDALDVYQASLGYEVLTQDTGRGDYHILHVDQAQMAGVMQTPDEEIHGWVPYVVVDDCAKIQARVQDNGGVNLGEPTVVEGVGEIALALDPTGVPFGVLKPSQG